MVFLHSFNVRLATHHVKLGISAEEVATMQSNTDNFVYLVNLSRRVQDTRDAFSRFKDTALYGDMNEPTPPIPVFPSVAPPETISPGIIPYLKMIIRKMKSSLNWTQQLAEEFGLWTDHPSPNPASIVPLLSGSALPMGEVGIKFRKYRREGIHLEQRLKGEQTWTSRGNFTRSPIVIAPGGKNGDPAAFEFRARFTEDDKPVGNFSTVMSIVTTP